MGKQKIFNIFFIFISIVLVSTTGYTAWIINKEIDKTILELNQYPIKQQDKKEILSPITKKQEKSVKFDINALEWKTYRNEEFGFEIDYPSRGWEFNGEMICKIADQGRFCIFFNTSYVLSPDCFNYNCKEIVESANKCFYEELYAINLEKTILVNNKRIGCQIRRFIGYPAEGVYVIIPLKTKTAYGDYIVLLLSYEKINATKADIEVFNKVVSSFRYIEK